MNIPPVVCPHCHHDIAVLAVAQIDMIRRILRCKISKNKKLMAIVLITDNG